jgi:type IV pilus assembly protein PilY1
VTDPTVHDGKVIFSTLMPDSNPCEPGGRSWLMILDLLTGQILQDSPIDTNGDGKIDGDDEQLSGYQVDEILTHPANLMCLTNDCSTDRLISSGSSGELVNFRSRSSRGGRGRQSWRQVR